MKIFKGYEYQIPLQRLMSGYF